LLNSNKESSVAHFNREGIYRKQGLSPEMIKALDELDEARREWHNLLAANPMLVMEVRHQQEEASQQP
jgi:hypothetical protein